MNTQGPDISIVIVAYNSADFIGRCLRSVVESQGRVRQQIIVIDNASQDGTSEFIKEHFRDVLLLTPGRNLGFAAGVNFGARHATGQFLLLLNPDTELRREAVEEIVAFARSRPSHGFYGGRTVQSNGSLQPSSCWGEPTLWSTIMFALGLSTLFPRHRWFDPESLGKWQRDTAREVGVISGCFLLARRFAWDDVGGLDERYFMYGEDVDLAIRARAKGYRPIICPTAELVHDVGQCSETPEHKSLLLYRGKASLIRNHWSGLRRNLGLFALVTGTGLRAALGSIVRRDAGRRWRVLWNARNSWLRGY